MATRKISDLTLLEAGSVSSSDTLLLLDNSDPTDQNKRSAVGSIFRAVPSGTYTTPGVSFEGKTSTGMFSETQGQVGLAMGDARLNLQKVGSTLNVQAKDAADTNLDITIAAQGTGQIRLGSILAITDNLFVIPNSSDTSKVGKFSTESIPAGVTHTYVLPSNGAVAASDTLVTLGATQTLTNKTLDNAAFTGTLSIVDFTSTGSGVLGTTSADTVTVNGSASFSAAATFNNTVVANQTVTITGDLIPNSHIDMPDDKVIKLGNDDDLQISHGDTTESLIVDTRASGSTLKIGADKIWLQNKDGDEPFIECTDDGSVKIYHDLLPKLETSATGINITGAIDAVTSITSTGNIVSTGSAHQLDGQLGIGRAAATYTLEVEGSIFATGSSLIIGDAGTSKSIIQKRVASSSLNFTDDTGADQAILDGGGQFGIGKTPGYKLDVSGDGWFDGDITINTTDPVNKTGGKITAREIVLTDPQTGSTATLNSGTGSGVSMAKVYFHSFN